MPIPTTLAIDELRARLAFWRAPRIGPELMENCLREFSSMRSLFEQKNQVTIALARLLEGADWYGADADLNWLSYPNHFLLQKQDLHFPRLLKETAGAPPFLFVRGHLECIEAQQIAIVGSRNPTYYGLQAARFFATDLVNAGFMVTSGLALGVDAAAHQAALQAKGRTLAVLAIGLDGVYPKRHEKLAEAIIAQQGALVSEFGVGMPPLPANFPRRNRLISGLSSGVIVVEATIKSGSLITARYAAEQSREVFAVPGSIFQPLSRGCHTLIKQGAKCAENIADVLSELRLPSTTVQHVNAPQLLPREKSMPLECADLAGRLCGRGAERVATCLGTEANEQHPKILQGDGYIKLFKEPTVALQGKPAKLLSILSEMPQSFAILLEQLTWPAGTLHAQLMALILDELVLETVYGYVRVKQSDEEGK